METKLIPELEEKAQRAQNEFKANLHSLEDHVAQSVEDVKMTVEDVKHKAEDAVTDVKDFVTSLNPVVQTERHPILGVSAAAVVGGLVGYRLGGPATRRMVRHMAAEVQQVPHFVASEGPSLLHSLSTRVKSSGLLSSPLAFATGARIAGWGRKTYPQFNWVIDALEEMVGAKSTAPSHDENGPGNSGNSAAPKTEKKVPNDVLETDILH